MQNLVKFSGGKILMSSDGLDICLYLGKIEMEYIPKYLGKFTGEMIKPIVEGDNELQNFENGEKCIVFKASDFYRWFESYNDTVNAIIEQNKHEKKNKLEVVIKSP